MAKVLLALLLLVTLTSSTQAAYPPRGLPPAHPPTQGHQPRRPHPPADPPKPPTPAPAPPAPPPYKLPKPPAFPKSLLAIQGVVYCKSCPSPPGYKAPWGTPIPGAVVKLECKNGYVQKAQTDRNGYYFIQGSDKLSTYWARFCKVKLFWSPHKTCNKPSTLHNGISGAYLRTENTTLLINKRPYALFSVDLLAYEYSKCKA